MYRCAALISFIPSTYGSRKKKLNFDCVLAKNNENSVLGFYSIIIYFLTTFEEYTAIFCYSAYT